MTGKRGSRGGVYDPTLTIRTTTAVREALQAFAASRDIKRSKAAHAILAEWLRTHGWLTEAGEKPVGPATDAVEAMDAAIKEHRSKRRR